MVAVAAEPARRVGGRPRVYLAGPITGKTFDGAQSWRDVAKDMLDQHGIDGYSPLRKQDYLRSEGVIENSGTRYAYNPLTSGKGLTARDYYDCTHADVVLANLLGATSVSIGTVMEIAWAYAHRIPVVLAMSDYSEKPDPQFYNTVYMIGNPHADHAMIRECVPYIVPTLEQALDIAMSILLP